jgi:hypothetical protein
VTLTVRATLPPGPEQVWVKSVAADSGPTVMLPAVALLPDQPPLVTLAALAEKFNAGAAGAATPPLNPGAMLQPGLAALVHT